MRSKDAMPAGHTLAGPATCLHCPCTVNSMPPAHSPTSTLCMLGCTGTLMGPQELDLLRRRAARAVEVDQTWLAAQQSLLADTPTRLQPHALSDVLVEWDNGPKRGQLTSWWRRMARWCTCRSGPPLWWHFTACFTNTCLEQPTHARNVTAFHHLQSDAAAVHRPVDLL